MSFSVVAVSATGKTIPCTARQFNHLAHAMMHTGRLYQDFEYCGSAGTWTAPGWVIRLVPDMPR